MIAGILLFIVQMKIKWRIMGESFTMQRVLNTLNLILSLKEKMLKKKHYLLEILPYFRQTA